MNRVFVRRPGSTLEANLRELGGSVSAAFKRATSTSVANTSEILGALSHLFGGLPGMKPRCGDCCDIPETECPPRCAAEIDWTICRGGVAHATLTVTNTGKMERQFSFSATPLSGPDAGGASLTVSPATAKLAPGHSAAVQVELSGTSGLHANQAYAAEVLIKGAWEQCVAIRCLVEADASATCAVRQGEVPMHVSAHNWYSHFQCTEPCFRTPNEIPTHSDKGSHASGQP